MPSMVKPVGEGLEAHDKLHALTLTKLKTLLC